MCKATSAMECAKRQALSECAQWNAQSDKRYGMCKATSAMECAKRQALTKWCKATNAMECAKRQALWNVQSEKR